jgi:hypothetical protein
MWVVSPVCGLLSIVLADDPKTGLPATDVLMIRARSRDHLVLLKSQHPILADIEILGARPGLDYPWRLVVDRITLIQVFAEMAAQVSWRNVKAESDSNKQEIGPHYVRAFHEVHAAFVRAEQRERTDADEEPPVA